jgi:putative membrane protein
MAGDKPIEIKKLDRIAWVLSGIVLILVLLMRRVKIDLGIDFSFLPPIHASLNALTAVVLVAAFAFIKRGKVDAHRKSMVTAIALSVLFLISYVLYHFTTPETSYGGEGIIRYFYYFLLITHILLAAIILPFILFTFIRAYTGHFQLHKKMARWVFPLWLYVAITGPICFLMLAPYYE